MCLRTGAYSYYMCCYKAVDHFLDYLITCLVYKMSENGGKCRSVMPKMMSSNVLFCPQLTHINFTVMEE